MTDKYDAIFSGVIGQDYELLNLICPLATKMSRLVGDAVSDYAAHTTGNLTVVELGGGTGITTLSLLTASDKLNILSIDNEPVMQEQAKKHLHKWATEGRLAFCGDDALTALKNIATGSVDIVASAYTLHNFLDTYRNEVLQEVFRILTPGGRFINGDRYGLDDVSKHTRTIQDEVSGYFKVLTQINKLDVLEHWIVHLFSDESENHVMRESVALKQLSDAGFSIITLSHRLEVNALVTATKPD
ncbi:MAG: class I SAM-dependent methyltransferase [Methylobacter tundripaludum]|uniref:Methyltransferase family protein n=1 Tax=Methylobacter tundripaludum TaxID=173365 RepID=A0A2S6GMX2_9GAMM|nr:class I SAM-dependent methyltransferase [Methylobacter tundripaludum]MCK9635611.1 class I SAM-dependent methyltransferase [Methylobacter tundripaludum]PPK66578.1 methyltransferase family protein [Methylobacter tundripaludum]